MAGGRCCVVDGYQSGGMGGLDPGTKDVFCHQVGVGYQRQMERFFTVLQARRGDDGMEAFRQQRLRPGPIKVARREESVLLSWIWEGDDATHPFAGRRSGHKQAVDQEAEPQRGAGATCLTTWQRGAELVLGFCMELAYWSLTEERTLGSEGHPHSSCCLAQLPTVSQPSLVWSAFKLCAEPRLSRIGCSPWLLPSWSLITNRCLTFPNIDQKGAPWLISRPAFKPSLRSSASSNKVRWSPARPNPNSLTYQRSPRCSAIKTEARGAEARKPWGPKGMFIWCQGSGTHTDYNVGVQEAQGGRKHLQTDRPCSSQARQGWCREHSQWSSRLYWQGNVSLIEYPVWAIIKSR